MSHYFTDNQDIPHNRKELSFRFLGVDYKFITDKAVFSPSEIDLGGISLIEAYLSLPKQGSLLDLGCGYGNVSIILNKITSTLAHGTDVNSRAVDLAIENNVLNQTNVKFYLSDGFEKIHQSFDTILFNPPIHAGKDVYYPLFEASKQFLNKDGLLLVVMRKNHGLKTAMKFCQTIYNQVKIIYKNKGYFVFECKL